MSFLKKLLGLNEPDVNTAFVSEHIQVKSIREFAGLSEEQRLLAIIFMGDKIEIDMQDFEYFKFAILYDHNIHVKLAALKRIHCYKEHPELNMVMLKLKENNNPNLEPYLSLALQRLGIASEAEIKNRLNYYKKNTPA